VAGDRGTLITFLTSRFGHTIEDFTPHLRVIPSSDLGGADAEMKFTVSLLALCAVAPIEGVAATPLSCAAAAPCPTMQKIFGACANVVADEIVCRTESKSLASPAHSSKTSFGYYLPPTGYSLEPETARAVFEGRGTHGVDASISDDQQLYCLWGTAGGGYAAGYCEVRARLIKSR
jgi:hypothetical protein